MLTENATIILLSKIKGMVFVMERIMLSVRWKQITARIRVLIWKLMVADIVKKFPIFLKTEM